MTRFKKIRNTYAPIVIYIFLLPLSVNAQTDGDAIMMGKKNFCVGGMFDYSSWQNYWEGTLKRNNQNLGTVSAKMYSVMGNYGITNKLNILFGVPYVQTHASAGTLHGLSGVQDLSLWVKWMPVEKQVGKKSLLSLYTLGGFSTPLSNYQADYLPLAIGLHSTTFSAKFIADYQRNSFFITASGAYTYRNDITIDRTAYYTTHMVLSNRVDMPDMVSALLRTGYRSPLIIAEAILQRDITLGGFDIRRNDMPFPSNRMNTTVAGMHIKYVIKNLPALSLEAQYSYVIAGRNVGQASTIGGGFFYIINFMKKAGRSNSTTQHTGKLCKVM